MSTSTINGFLKSIGVISSGRICIDGGYLPKYVVKFNTLDDAAAFLMYTPSNRMPENISNGIFTNSKYLYKLMSDEKHQQASEFTDALTSALAKYSVTPDADTLGGRTHYKSVKALDVFCLNRNTVDYYSTQAVSVVPIGKAAAVVQLRTLLDFGVFIMLNPTASSRMLYKMREDRKKTFIVERDIYCALNSAMVQWGIRT